MNKNKIMATLAAAVLAAGVLLAAAPTMATNAGVCVNYSTGHLKPGNSGSTTTYTAPAGQYITGYCVKAGSAQQVVGGPEEFVVDPPATSITFSHSTLKDISHYSVLLVTDQCLGMDGYQDDPADCAVVPTPTSGTPVTETITCRADSRNWVTLPAVDGGSWTLTLGANSTSYASYSGVEPFGYGTYTIALLDANPNDLFAVTAGSWPWSAVDALTLPCVTAPTGEPKFEYETCQPDSQNLVTLGAVDGGRWEIEQSGTVTEHDTYTGTPSGYDEYTIHLVDKDPNDKYEVATKTWTYTAIDSSTLKCATAEDPSWSEQVCNPAGIGFTSASYTIMPATGVRYKVSLDDGVTYTDATPAGTDPVRTDVTTFPTRVIIKADPLPGYELVGTSEFSHVFVASTSQCIDADASAKIEYTQPTCWVAGSIDIAASTLVNATWKTAPLPTVPGNYTVVAQADSGHAFSDGKDTKSFDVTILPVKTGVSCDPPTLAILTPTAKATQPTCTAAGSYTLAGLEGAQFNWTVNGAATTVPNGTYPAPAGGGDVVLIAAPVDPKDGIQDWTNPTTLTFSKALSAASCADLPTLAFTGGMATTGLFNLAGGLVFLGICGIYLARRQLLASR